MWDQTSDTDLKRREQRKKLSINSMIGLWANPTNYVYTCTTEEPGYTDVIFEGVMRTRYIEEFGLEQNIRQYEQVSNSCIVPIHMQILDIEQLLLTRMREMLTTTCRLTMRNIKECRVDSCLIQSGDTRAGEVLDKVERFTNEDYINFLKEEARTALE